MTTHPVLGKRVWSGGEWREGGGLEGCYSSERYSERIRRV